jgi:hypothetical protein
MAIILGACVLLGLPVLVDLAHDPVRRPFGYVAADVFYYLSVARNIVLRGSISMDGIHPTNGFHPLWQLCVTICYALAKVVHHPALALLMTVLTGLACVVVAVWIIGQLFVRVSRTVPFLFVGLPFGLYGLIILPQWANDPSIIARVGGSEGPYPLFGTLYSYVNGMESGLAILAFAVLAKTLIRCGTHLDVKSGIRCALALIFLTFARLDHAVFAIFPLCYWCVEAISDRRRRRFAFAAVGTFAFALLLFLVCNKLYAGLALPVSGAAKSTFPMPHDEVMTGFMNYLHNPLARHSLVEVSRYTPSMFSLIATLFYLGVVLRPRVQRRGLALELRPFTTVLDGFLVMMAPGIILLDLYNILFVTGIGHWYFSVTTLCISLNFLCLWSALVSRWRDIPGFYWPNLVRIVGGVSLAALTLVGFVRYHRQLQYHKAYADFYLTVAPRVREALHGKIPKIFEVDDGIVGYGLGVAVMSSGLTLDREGSEALAKGQLLQLAIDRGFSTVATLYYGQHNLTPASTRDEATKWVEALHGIPPGYHANVVYGDSSFTMVSLIAN